MALAVEIQVNSKQLDRFLEELKERELPFTTSLALNLTGKKAVEAIREELPSRFTIRNQGLAKRFGFNFIPKAEVRRQWPHLKVEVGTLDEFWIPHEEGGPKKPRGVARFAIPTAAVRRTKTGIIRKSHRPKALGDKASVVKLSDGKPALVLKRKLRGVDSRVAYLLRRQVQIKKQLGLRETVHKATHTWFNRMFEQAFEHAKKTSRDRAMKVKP